MSEASVELPLAGGPICVVPDSNALLTPFVLREQEDWFEDEIRFVRKLVKPGMPVIDIGANYGTYTLSMAGIVGSSGVVHAFEPASQPLRMLKQSLRVNRFPWVTLHEVGLSSRSGTATLAVSANPELNSLTGQQDEAEEVELTTLDTVLGGSPHRFAFIKMDAEGEEERILEGAPRFFAEQDPVVMFELKHGAEINEGLCEAFMRRGFLIHRLIPGPNVLAPVPIGEPLDGFLLNAFAVRPVAEAQLIADGLLVPLRAPLPEAVGQIKVQEVIARLATAPWLQTIAPAWSPDAAVPGWDEHRRAVALAASAVDPGLSAVGQVACLRQAQRAIRKALSQGVTGSRRFTAARIAFDLGYRAEAVNHVRQIAELTMSSQDLAPSFKEPFLLPLRQHEQVTGLCLNELIGLVALETLAWKAGFSAYFISAQVQPLYERVVAMAGHARRSEVTLQLLKDIRRPTSVRI